MRLLLRSSRRATSRRAPVRVVALAVMALLMVPVVGGSGAWFTDSQSVSGSASAATLGALSPTVVATDAGNTVSWRAATEQAWATDAGVTSGVTYSVQRQVEGRPAQKLGTTSYTSFTDPGGQPFGTISAGGTASFGVAPDGSVWAWGDDSSGQLGNGQGTASPAQTPVRVEALWDAGVQVTQVSAGSSSAFAVASDGSVWAWGFGGGGVLGDGDASAHVSAPVRVDALWDAGVRVTQVSAGEQFALAVASDGSVWAWGDGEGAVLGDRDASRHFSAPVRVDALWGAGVRAVQVSAGELHALAVASDGSVWSWGSGAWGVLGDGVASGHSSEPLRVDSLWDAGVRVAQVSAGIWHSAAVALDGSVWAWGSGRFGRLGDGVVSEHVSGPVRLDAMWDAGMRATQVSAAPMHSLAVASDGSVWAWGSGENGVLGDGDESDHVSGPRRVDALWDRGKRITQASAGASHSVAVASDGSVWAWGPGWNGLLGNGSTTDQSVPGPVGARTLTQVSAGVSHSLALASDGSVWAWGDGAHGRLGDGDPSFRSSSLPVPVRASWRADDPTRKITQVAAGDTTSLALASDGSVWAWGSGSDGQLGPDVRGDSATPVRVPSTGGNGLKITKVAVGGGQCLAIAADGSVWQWGTISDESTTETVPTKVDFPSNWVLSGYRASDVSAGPGFALVVSSVGDLWGWGVARSDQMQGMERAAKPQLIAPRGAQAISAGTTHVLELSIGKDVWAWGGRPSRGSDPVALGDGSAPGYGRGRVDVAAPWFRASPRVWATQVAAGRVHSMVLASDGSVWAWGDGSNGRLGTGKMETALTPQAVNPAWSNDAGRSITQVSAGGSHSLALASDGSAWAWGAGGSGQLGDGGVADQATPVAVPSAFAAANCPPPSTLVGRSCTLPGTTTYSVSYDYRGWSSPVATAAITR
ncbi:hypothetical protein P2P98_17110 [Microbacterium sp. Kw_RZR3]|uniref:RCC1 domain-containing protein n=1 Tax=Microbacterium sp. Kw_RZR3 TaxID=3032903 RepID=UPI0023DC53DB|nr:RCC1 domain-containing protein [Microbacterium sp. Kw_RZR3]MDF2047887.1 hypothetical protein [Microbacterium sp. Kw_RZR3]